MTANQQEKTMGKATEALARMRDQQAEDERELAELRQRRMDLALDVNSGVTDAAKELRVVRAEITALEAGIEERAGAMETVAARAEIEQQLAGRDEKRATLLTAQAKLQEHVSLMAKAEEARKTAAGLEEQAQKAKVAAVSIAAKAINQEMAMDSRISQNDYYLRGAPGIFAGVLERELEALDRIALPAEMEAA